MEMEAQLPSEPPWYALVADDDEDNRSLTASLLRHARLTVHEATNGEELVECYRALESRMAGRLLVISDVQMPGMDGIEATRELRALSASTPIVLMTGFTDSQIATAAHEAGANAVLAKPVEARGLLKIVEHFVHCSVTQR